MPKIEHAKTKAHDVLRDLKYFHEGDPALEKCIDHLLTMTYQTKGGVHILLHGQTGTGKEKLARAAHTWMSEQQMGKFIPLNCAAINKDTAVATFFGANKGAYTGCNMDMIGIFGQAVGPSDTVFLDEIHQLPESVRASLLRVLGEGKFLPMGARSELNFKGNVIAASSSNLWNKTKSGEFPHDLYYRLNTGGEVRVPSLKERTAEYRSTLIDFGCKNWGIEPFSLDDRLKEQLLDMTALALPGNIRELESMIKQLSNYARFNNGIATPEHLTEILSNKAADDEGTTVERPSRRK
ncbi:MAG: hypothetical protein Greene101449_78 [Candidatus Peregrinibacteria bacterium Greene1014_49]|nr:MAG: hypothetical protein Greene101449_78 [Candidatus Peregrinibacteria bacterium Greene1014_49]